MVVDLVLGTGAVKLVDGRNHDVLAEVNEVERK